MTTKTFVLLDGRELTTEEAIQELLKRTNNNFASLRQLHTDVGMLISRVNELQEQTHDH